MALKLTTQEKEQMMRRGLEDPVYFCRLFLGEWFPKCMPWVHRGLLAILLRKTDFLLNFGKERWAKEEGEWTEEGLSKICRHFTWSEDPGNPASPKHSLFTVHRDDNGKPIKIELLVSKIQMAIMPRGFSKTTTCNAAVVIYVVYKMKQFIVYVSETMGHASAQLDSVGTQLEENEILRELFGVLVPDRAHPNTWRSDEKQTLNDIYLIARGRGGQVRGLNRNGRRPDMVLIDDVEDEESVATEEQRKKTLKWFQSGVRPALPRNNPKAFIQLLGTMLDREALLPTLAKDPSIVNVRFGAVDPDGEMLWASHMSRAEYEAEKESYRRVGTLNVFNREFDSTITNEEEQIFPKAFTYISRLMEEFPVRALVCDPAISENLKADFCAFAVVGRDYKGRIHVLDVFLKRGMSPREQVDKFFELKDFWKTNRNGVEAIAYQKALVHLIKDEMFHKAQTMGDNAYFEVLEIRHNSDKDKLKRVQGVLAARYSAGYITHQRQFFDYESQLEDWPNGKKDGPDAVAMAVTLLDDSAGLILSETLPDSVPGEDRWKTEVELGEDDWRYSSI